jgi:uncharacterized membrane-anchored protein
MEFRAKARLDHRTKNLAKRIQQGEIAIIDHADLDQVSADSLIKARVRLVINASPSITGKYPNPGPAELLKEGIGILDNVGPDVFQKVHEGDIIEIRNNQIWKNDVFVAKGVFLEQASVQRRLKEIRGNLVDELDKFLHNTLEYASKEKDLILGNLTIPDPGIKFEGKPVLVVVRGYHYREDLTIIRSYIRDVNPILIGVDGGADALIEFGFKPHLIMGDMDSITDEALRCGAKIIVHAYPDGRAPGLERIEKMQLQAQIFPAPGTSEDIALLLAYEKGADLIVAVGTHSNMIDFLEKGRKGMGSTFLVRLKVGAILVDARGVSRIYQGRVKLKYLAWLTLAGISVILMVLYEMQWTRNFLRTLWLQVKILTGI